jgi:hypothetical protein
LLNTPALRCRSVYRIIELTGGWTGRIFHTEVYFNVLNGGMVTLAIFALDFTHPGVFLRPSREEAKAEAVKLMSMDGGPV